MTGYLSHKRAEDLAPPPRGAAPGARSGERAEPQPTCFCGGNHLTGWCLRDEPAVSGERAEPAHAESSEVGATVFDFADRCPGSGLGPNGASVMEEREDGWYARCLTCDEVVKLACDAEGLIALVPHTDRTGDPA